MPERSVASIYESVCARNQRPSLCMYLYMCLIASTRVGSAFSLLRILINASLFQITLNQEHKYMLSFAPDYDHLPLIAKVEVFDYALQNTEGNDLARVCILDGYSSLIFFCSLS